MPTIYISYRRDDSRWITSRIYDRLAQEFGRENIHIDVSTLPSGVDLRAVIRPAIQQSTMLLAVIGPNWRGDVSRQFEIDDPVDSVHAEIAIALQEGLPIIPLLVYGALPLDEELLPPDIRPLARMGAFRVRNDPYFHEDMAQLISLIESTPRYPPRGGTLHALDGVDYFPEDDDHVSARTLQFSAFHPNEIATGAWSTLLVYTYVAEALAQIQADAATFTELGSAPQEARGHSTRKVRQGVELAIEPHMDGVTFSPASDTFIWRGDWRRSLFRLMADAVLAGTTQKGWIDIYAGRMSPIATIDVSFSFHHSIPRTGLSAPSGMAVTANTFDTVFLSYSHRDEEPMRQARRAYDQLGITVLVDELLEAGDNFDEKLMDMIQAANVFHLLWSRRSAASDYVRKEWTSALASGKGERFVRPWYWRKPLATPPAEMEARKISFKYERLKRRILKPSTWF